MASDRKQFAEANRKWESLLEDGYLSKPAELGKIALISSSFTDEEPDTETGIAELESFRTEAYSYADRVISMGEEPEVVIDATRGDITRVIQDPDISSVVVIGNGSLSALITDVDERYEWQDVAEATTHLKQGVFVQRQCGGLKRDLNVPLGYFALSDARNLFAAVGVEFYPLSLKDPENNKVHRVFSSPRVAYEDIKQLKADEWRYDRISQLYTPDFSPNTIMQRVFQLAGSLPKINHDDRDPLERWLPEKAHNEFSQIFTEVSAVLNGRATNEQASYIRHIKERFGLDLPLFYEDNRELCDQVVASIEILRSYEQLERDIELLEHMEATGRFSPGKIARIKDAINYPDDVKAMGTYCLEDLNNLLEEAYRRLEKITLNAPYLTYSH